MSTTVGTGIALLTIGAILGFAVRDVVPGVDLTLTGYICMGAGVLAIILGLTIVGQTRRRPYRNERDDL